MMRFGSQAPSLARVSRRGLIAGAGALGVAGCSQSKPLTASKTPPLNTKRLDEELRALSEKALPGVLGVGVMNLESGEMWALRGQRRFPMQSVFKLPLGAYALAEVEAHQISLDDRVTIEAEDLSPYSAIADAWPARKDYSLRELLTAAVTVSDNTAADLLMRKVGGPGALTAWLDAKGVKGVRIDRYEREIQTELFGMASYRAGWKGEAAFKAARATVAPEARLAAMLRYMADPRDTATPYGMLDFLSKLDGGELISAANTRWLTKTVIGTRVATRLAAGIPKDAQLAHKSGTGPTDQGLCVACNDVGIITLADKRSYAVAAFLSGSIAPNDARDAIIADVARIIVRSVG